MQIKTADGERNVSSKALGGTALGLAIPGTLSFLSQLGGGFFNGGNNAGTCQDTRTIGVLESKIAQLEAERYTDKVGTELYREIVAKSNAEDEKINANYKELAQYIAQLDKQIAVDKQATVDNFAFLNNEICNTKKEIMCYVNATFVPGKLVMPLSSICPEAMQRYNSWTAPTTPATGT